MRVWFRILAASYVLFLAVDLAAWALGEPYRPSWWSAVASDAMVTVLAAFLGWGRVG